MEYLITIVFAGCLWLLLRYTDNPIGNYFRGKIAEKEAAAKARFDAEVAEGKRKLEKYERKEAERKEERLRAEARSLELRRSNTKAVLDAVQAADAYKQREALAAAIPTHLNEDHIQLKALDHIVVDAQLDRLARKVTFMVDWGKQKIVADSVRIRKHSKILTNSDTASSVGAVVVDERAVQFTKTVYLQPGEAAYFYIQLSFHRYREVQEAWAAYARALHAGDEEQDEEQLEQLITRYCGPLTVSFYFAAELTDNVGVAGASGSRQKIDRLKEIERDAARDKQEIDDDTELSEEAKINAKSAIEGMKEAALRRLFGDAE